MSKAINPNPRSITTAGTQRNSFIALAAVLVSKAVYILRLKFSILRNYGSAEIPSRFVDVLLLTCSEKAKLQNCREKPEKVISPSRSTFKEKCA